VSLLPLLLRNSPAERTSARVCWLPPVGILRNNEMVIALSEAAQLPSKQSAYKEATTVPRASDRPTGMDIRQLIPKKSDLNRKTVVCYIDY
jgi:hypothetical protein